jgi:hypothetical protein
MCVYDVYPYEVAQMVHWLFPLHLKRNKPMFRDVALLFFGVQELLSQNLNNILHITEYKPAFRILNVYFLTNESVDSNTLQKKGGK